MTKRRPPLTIDAALARVAGQLPGGWADVASACGRKVSLVRAWGDPDRRENIPLADAIALDLAYRAAGGEGAPLFETYAYQLDEAGIFRFADQVELGRLTATAIKEGGEAFGALVLAAQPGADRAQYLETLRECDEHLGALQRVRLLVAALAGGGHVDAVGLLQRYQADVEHHATDPPD